MRATPTNPPRPGTPGNAGGEAPPGSWARRSRRTIPGRVPAPAPKTTPAKRDRERQAPRQPQQQRRRQPPDGPNAVIGQEEQESETQGRQPLHRTAAGKAAGAVQEASSRSRSGCRPVRARNETWRSSTPTPASTPPITGKGTKRIQPPSWNWKRECRADPTPAPSPARPRPAWAGAPPGERDKPATAWASKKSPAPCHPFGPGRGKRNPASAAHRRGRLSTVAARRHLQHVGIERPGRQPPLPGQAQGRD